jgi:hypothetical protein
MIGERVKYPKEFPLLGPDKFICGEWNLNKDGVNAQKSEECHVGCLEGWGIVIMEGQVFNDLINGGHQRLPRRRWYKILAEAVRQVATECGISTDESHGLREVVMGFNDRSKSTPKIRAKTWARFGALMGYTEGNPEAK